MSGNSNYHVTKQGDQWSVRDLARTAKAEVVIHRPNGQIRDKDSYGNDPNPPRDRRH